MQKRLIVTMFAILSATVISSSFANYSEGTLKGSASGLFSSSISVDGSLADWGVYWVTHGLTAQVDRTNSDWKPSVAGVSYTIEDGVNSSNKGYIGPGYGGQNYDEEAAYIGASAARLNLAFVTGTDKAGQYGWNTTKRYTCGDIFVDLNGDGKWDFAVATTNHDGLTAGSVYAPTAAYKSSQWWSNAGISSSGAAKIIANEVTDICDLGSQFIYTNATTSDDNALAGDTYSALDHNVIEVSIPWATLAAYSLKPGSTITAHLTQSCGNDVLDVNGSPVPEPATLALLSAGLGGVVVRRWKRRSRP